MKSILSSYLLHLYRKCTPSQKLSWELSEIESFNISKKCFLRIFAGLKAVVCQKWGNATERLTGVFINAGWKIMETWHIWNSISASHLTIPKNQLPHRYFTWDIPKWKIAAQFTRYSITGILQGIFRNCSWILWGMKFHMQFRCQILL